MPLDITTRPVGFEEQLNAIVNRINRRGLPVKLNASNFTQPLGRITDKANEFQKSIEASNARVIAFGASAAIIGSVGKAFEQMVVQAVKVEKVLTDINVVLGTSAANLEKFGNQLFDVARNTAQTLDTAAEAALEFSRQGLSMEETLKRTNDALILTRLTGMKAADSVKGLTAAVNSYADAGVSTTDVINKLAAVDVKFAVSADDLVNALSRAGAVAQEAGLSMDQLIASVTSAQQITARGGAVIGNSFKTIFTRLQRSSTLDRLEELGVAVRNVQGETLPAMQVLTGLAKTYDTLGDSTKAAVAEQVGGVFQINILKAAMKDLANANSLNAQALKVSSSATDQAAQKNAMLNRTLSSLAAQTSLTLQELAANLGELALAPGIESLLEKINSIGDSLNNLLSDDSQGIGSDFAKGIVKGIGNVITGPGMVLAIGVFAKLFFNALKFAKQSLKDVLGIVTQKDREKKIQEGIVEAMSQNRILADELNKAAGDKLKQEQIILGVIEAQTKQMEAQMQIASKLAPALARAGVNTDLTMPTTGAAKGFIPNFNKKATSEQERIERSQATKAGYTAGAVKLMDIPGVGEVAYNQAEKIKKFKGMKQPAIMPPASSRAGKKYQKTFNEVHGFDPYAAQGFVPNFVDRTPRDVKIKRALADPANKNIKFKQKEKTDLQLRKNIESRLRKEYNLDGAKPGALEEIVEGLLRSYKKEMTGYGVGGKGSSREIFYGTPPNQIRINRFGVDNPSAYGEGFIPNFARREGDLLKLNPAFQSVAVGSGGLRNRSLDKQVEAAIKSGKPMYVEAGLDEITSARGSHNAPLYDLLQTLKSKGVNRIGRDMFFQGAAKSTMLKRKKHETDGELSERAKLQQLHSAGDGKSKAIKQLKSESGLAGGLGITPDGKKVLPEQFKKYISTGGKDGNDTFNTDLIGEGLRPIENKKGRYSLGNLLYKSLRSYSDYDFLKYVNDSHPDVQNLVAGLNTANYRKSERLLESKGLIHSSMSPEEKRKKILETFTASGYIPNFAFKNTAIRLDGGFGRRGRQIAETETGSYMNYTTNEIGDREIDFLQSNKKGDAFKMFKREAGGQFMKKGGAYTSPSLKQQKSYKQGSRTNFEDLVHAFPQLQYRMQPNLITTGRLIHGPEGKRIRFDSLKELRSSVNKMDRQGFKDALGAYPGMPGMDVISVQDLTTVNTKPNLSDDIYGQAAKGLLPARKGSSSVKPRALDLTWISPERGQGPAQIRSIYKDITESAKAGRPYTDLKAGFVIGPRIPRLLVEGHKLLNRQRSSGKNIPRMKITGDMTPSKLMQYIHENKQRSADGNPFASKEDYKEGEEREVANYLRAMGLDPLSSTSVAIEDLAMFKNGFAGGLIPSFANKVFDSDRLRSSAATEILNNILNAQAKKDLMIGPSGVGKSTRAARKGNFIQSLDDLDDASVFTILSGAGLSKTGLSPKLQQIIQSVNKSGGKVSYIAASDKTIEERREKRIASPMTGDLRSERQLKGTLKAPKNQDGFIELLKSQSARFETINAGQGFIPNFVDYSNIFDGPSGKRYLEGSIDKGSPIPIQKTVKEINASMGGGMMREQKKHPVDDMDMFKARVVPFYQNKDFKKFNSDANSITSKLLNDPTFRDTKPASIHVGNKWMRDSMNAGADKSALQSITTAIRNYQLNPRKRNEGQKNSIRNNVIGIEGEVSAARTTGSKIGQGNEYFDLRTASGERIEVKTKASQSPTQILRKGANQWLKTAGRKEPPILNKKPDMPIRDLGNLNVMVPKGAKVSAKGLIPNFIKSRIAGREYAKLSTSLARFNSRNMITPPLKSLSGAELFKIPRRNADVANQTIQNLRQYISSDEFRQLPPELQEKVTKFYNRKFARRMQDSPGRSFTKYSDPTYEGRIAASFGLIPNFAKSDALKEAINRERQAGIPKSQIRIEKDKSLENEQNPLGLAVTNLRDEPGGIKQGIRRAKFEGRDPQKYGAAKGFIPNYEGGGQAVVDSTAYERTAQSMEKMQMSLFGLTTATYAMQGIFEETGMNFMGTFNDIIQTIANTALVWSALGPIAGRMRKAGEELGRFGDAMKQGTAEGGSFSDVWKKAKAGMGEDGGAAKKIAETQSKISDMADAGSDALEKQSQCIEKNVSAACSAVAGMQGGATTPGLSQPVGPLATTATVNPAVTSGPVLKDSKGKSLATRTPRAGKLPGAFGRIAGMARGMGSTIKTVMKGGRMLGQVVGTVAKVGSLFGRLSNPIGWVITGFQAVAGILSAFDINIGSYAQSLMEAAGMSNQYTNSLEELQEATEKAAESMAAFDEIDNIESKLEDMYAKNDAEISSKDMLEINKLTNDLIKAQRRAAEAMNEFADASEDVVDRIEGKDNDERSDLDNEILKLNERIQSGTATREEVQRQSNLLDTDAFIKKQLEGFEEASTKGLDFWLGDSDILGMGDDVKNQTKTTAKIFGEQAGRLDLDTKSFDALMDTLEGSDADQSLKAFENKLRTVAEDPSLDKISQESAKSLATSMSALMLEMQDEGYTRDQMNKVLKDRAEQVRKEFQAAKAEEKEIKASTMMRKEFNKNLQHAITLQNAEFKHRDNMLKKELSLMNARLSILNKMNVASQRALNEQAGDVQIQSVQQSSDSEIRRANVDAVSLTSDTRQIQELFNGNVADDQLKDLADKIKKVNKALNEGAISAKEGFEDFRQFYRNLRDQDGNILTMQADVLNDKLRNIETVTQQTANIRETADTQVGNIKMDTALKNMTADQMKLAKEMSAIFAGEANMQKTDQEFRKSLIQVINKYSSVQRSTGELENMTTEQLSRVQTDKFGDRRSAEAVVLGQSFDNARMGGRFATSMQNRVSNSLTAQRYNEQDSQSRGVILEALSQMNRGVRMGRGDTGTPGSTSVSRKQIQVNEEIDEISKQLIDLKTSLPDSLIEAGPAQVKLQEQLRALGAKKLELEEAQQRQIIEESKGRLESMSSIEAIGNLRLATVQAETSAKEAAMAVTEEGIKMSLLQRTRTAEAQKAAISSMDQAKMENQSAGIIRSILENNKNVDQALTDRVNLITQGNADEVEYTKFISGIKDTLQNEQSSRIKSIAQLDVISQLRRDGIKTELGVLKGSDLERLAIEEAVKTKRNQIDQNYDMLSNQESMRQEAAMQLSLERSESDVSRSKAKILLNELKTNVKIQELREKIVADLEEQTALNQAETIRLREQLNERKKPTDGQASDTVGIQETRSIIENRIAEDNLSLQKAKEERQLLEESVANKLTSMDLETEQLKLETDILRTLNESSKLSEEESVVRKSLLRAVEARVDNEIEQLERDAQNSEDTLKTRKNKNFFGIQAGTDRRQALTAAEDKVLESQARRDSYGMSGNTLKSNEANVDLAKNLKEFNIEAGRNTLFWDTINVKIAEATERAARFSETLAETAFDGVKDGFKGLLKDLSEGTMSAGDAFLKMAASIAGKIQDKMFDQAADRMTAGLFDMMGMNKFHTGGMVTNFNSGGRTKSDVPAMLTAGEYVVRKKAVDSIGRQALERMNRGESLEDLFEKPNSETFDILGGDMQSFGSPSNSPMQTLSAPLVGGGMLSANSPSEDSNGTERIEERLKEINNNFKEGGSVSNSTSKTIEKLFSGGAVGHYNYGGGVQNISRQRTKDQNWNDIGYGVGMMGGTALGAYMGRNKQAPGAGPPEPPKMNKLNTSSTLDLDIRDPRLSSRFRKMDTTSQDYAKYLLDKYEYNVQKQNKKVADRAKYIGQIANSLASLAGAAIGSSIGNSIQNRYNGAKMNGSGMNVGKGPSGEVVKIHRDKTGNVYATEGGRRVNFMAGDGKTQSPAAQHMSDWAVQNDKTGSKLSGKDAAEWWSSYTASGRPGFADNFKAKTSASSAELWATNYNIGKAKSGVEAQQAGKGLTSMAALDKNYSMAENKAWSQNFGSHIPMSLNTDSSSPYYRALEDLKYASGGSVTNSTAMNQTTINKQVEQNLNRIYNDAITPQAKAMKYFLGGAVNNYGNIKGYSEGGSVSGPAGIDKVGPLMLDEGEFVIRSRSVQKMEREYPGMLDRLNKSGGFAEGGLVSNQNSNSSNVSSSNTENNSNNNVTVNINVGSSSSDSGATSVEGNATEGQTAMAGKLKAAVLQVIAEEQRVGGMLRGN